MKAFRFFSLLVILLAVLFVACALGGDEPPAVPEDGGEPGAGEEEPATVEITPAGTVTDEVTHGGPIEDYVSLVDALRFTGATVEPVEGVDQPFFEPQPKWSKSRARRSRSSSLPMKKPPVPRR